MEPCNLQRPHQRFHNKTSVVVVGIFDRCTAELIDLIILAKYIVVVMLTSSKYMAPR